MTYFYKYFFSQRSFLSSHKDTVIFDIDISNPKKHNSREGSYVTPDRFCSNFFSRYKLSITYVPNFRYELNMNTLQRLFKSNKLTLLDNKQQEINSIYALDLEALERVWPSFGYYGGAREVFLCFDTNSKIDLKLDHQFPIPGNLDFYHSDDDETISFDLDYLIAGITNLYQSQNESLFGDGIVQLKKTGKNVSINFTNYNKINITASIAYNDVTPSTHIKCWLNAWQDDLTLKKRNVYFSQSAEYIFYLVNITTLTRNNQFMRNLFYPLFDELKRESSNFIKNGSIQNPLFSIILT